MSLRLEMIIPQPLRRAITLPHRSDEAKNVWLRQSGFRVVWRSHANGTRTVVDEFRLDGDLTMDLDADAVFGPILDIVAALSDPANFEDAPSE